MGVGIGVSVDTVLFDSKKIKHLFLLMVSLCCLFSRFILVFYEPDMVSILVPKRLDRERTENLVGDLIQRTFIFCQSRCLGRGK